MKNINGENKGQVVERRTVLKILIAGLNVLIAVILAVPGAGYIMTPLLRKESQTWLKIGKTTAVPSGSFTKEIFRFISSSGYVREEKKDFVWMRREDSGEFTAFSPKCTHMGCNVSWNVSANRFECPCHGGMYDEYGNVISGPPPRALDRYPTKIENDTIYLKKAES